MTKSKKTPNQLTLEAYQELLERERARWEERDKLPQTQTCPKCKKEISPHWWRTCPYCGEPSSDEKDKDETDNLMKAGFSILMLIIFVVIFIFIVIPFIF